MDNFTNDSINLDDLPKYQEVRLQPIHRDYWKAVLWNNGLFWGIIALALLLIVLFVSQLTLFWKVSACIIFVVSVLLAFSLLKVSVAKKAFAFRQHDVILRSGILATKTRIVPYNRVQHVALHEGFFSRKYQLATVEIFTAGSDSGDIKIPGIQKDKAEELKQLVMGKINQEV